MFSGKGATGKADKAAAQKGLHVVALTLYPQMFPGVLGFGLLGRAREKGLWHLDTLNIRDFAEDAHASVDAPACGGGSGMVLLPDVVDKAIAATVRLVKAKVPRVSPRILYMSARGKPFTQAFARDLAAPVQEGEVQRPLIILCGRFEGVDQRVLDFWKADEVTLGDFVLMGGEVAAMAVLEATLRLLPGVLGNPQSLEEESFEDGLLEYPQYTKPRVWKGLAVPDILLSGHHKNIDAWRQNQRLQATEARRPDLLAKSALAGEKAGSSKKPKKPVDEVGQGVVESREEIDDR